MEIIRSAVIDSLCPEDGRKNTETIVLVVLVRNELHDNLLLCAAIHENTFQI